MSKRSASPAQLATRSVVDDCLADLPDGSRVIVACSGGPDSLALAGATAWVAPRRGLTAHAVVIDHALQPGSDLVAAEAARLCVALGLSDAEVIAVEVGSDGGPEAAARAARYSALAAAADRLEGAAVLLGHTRDDQAETVLLRLARGSGARSLSAMRPRTDPWRRPFLGLSRSQVHQAAADALEPLGAAPWTDPHNSDPTYARVRVRAVLADLAGALGAGAVLGLSRSAELLHDDAEALDAQAEVEFARVVESEDGEMRADITGLRDLPRALRTRVIRLIGLRAGCPAEDLGYEHITQIEALVTDWHGQGELRLPGRVVAGRAYDRLWLRSTAPPFRPPS